MNSNHDIQVVVLPKPNETKTENKMVNRSSTDINYDVAGTTPTRRYQINHQLLITKGASNYLEYSFVAVFNQILLNCIVI